MFDYDDLKAELTWGDLLEEIVERGLCKEEDFEYGGISHSENKAIEESLVWSKGVTGVAVFCRVGINNDWFVQADPTYAKGMVIYGGLGKGLLGKFDDFERAIEAVKFITKRVYAQDIGSDKDSSTEQ
ncbi:hypothetical protein KKA03_06530 [archaeon]|nr:hypothetical protein [archaeon]